MLLFLDRYLLFLDLLVSNLFIVMEVFAFMFFRFTFFILVKALFETMIVNGLRRLWNLWGLQFMWLGRVILHWLMVNFIYWCCWLLCCYWSLMFFLSLCANAPYKIKAAKDKGPNKYLPQLNLLILNLHSHKKLTLFSSWYSCNKFTLFPSPPFLYT